MAADQGTPDTDDRLDEVQEDVDQIRERVEKNPLFDVPDPDIDPVMGDDAEANPPL
jgi:hypothetical protein